MPHRSSVAMPWRLRESRYSVTGTACDSCGNKHMPPRRVCECGNEVLQKFTFSGQGEVISFTEIHVGPAGFDTPYNIALIRLDEGPVISGIVVDKEGLEVGRKVQSVFRKLSVDGDEGLITYGFKFELVD